MKACIVLTTIFDPVVLDSYYRNFQRFGRLEQVEIIVVPDRKTPPAAWTRCQEISHRGLRADCPTLEAQEAFLKRVGLNPEFIPYNSDNRRNAGFLMALERDCDFVISLDDDNYAIDNEDLFAQHALVAAGPSDQDVLESSTGYFNICDLLEFENGKEGVYPRGFPFSARHQAASITRRRITCETPINAGLWVLDPDVDALTWLVMNPRGRAFRGSSEILGPGTWSPVNTQNTALRREALAAYYFIRMGYPVAGLAIDRYGDIFSGYFVQACAKHLGGLVRFGTPVAKHRRNTHNYLRDGTMEWGAILVLEDLLPWLREVKLSGATWLEAYRCLSDELESFAGRLTLAGSPSMSDSARGFLRQTAGDMRIWVAACGRLL
jgi:glycosyltransferase involved in cell wall biosynthesis